MMTGKKYVLAKDVPLFSGVIKAGTPVTITQAYCDAADLPLVSVRAGFVEISGLVMSSLVEQKMVDPF